MHRNGTAGLVPEGDVERSKATLNGLTVHFVHVKEGVFQGGISLRPRAPAPGSALRAAIVGTKVGPRFVRLVGPKKTLDAAGGPFRELLASLEPVGS